MKFFGRFMAWFGAVSSVFDVLTFALLLVAFSTTADTFRTAWFVESLLTELVIALVVRTRRPFHRSRPGKVLLVTTLILIPVTFAIPYLPYADVLGFVPLPVPIVLALVAITSGYVGATELVKARFYAGRTNRPPGPGARKRFAFAARQTAARSA
jgi:Mg2+-importing ATPase